MDTSVSKRFHELASNPRLIDGLKEAIRKVASRDNIELIVRFKIRLLVRLLFSCLIDADRTNTADFENPRAAKNRPNSQYTEWDLLIERLDQKPDAEAALQTILKLPEIENKDIIVLGQSIGGAIAIYMAATSPYKNRITLLVIDRSFSIYHHDRKGEICSVFHDLAFSSTLCPTYSVMTIAPSDG